MLASKLNVTKLPARCKSLRACQRHFQTTYPAGKLSCCSPKPGSVGSVSHMCLTAAPREPAAAIQQRLHQLQVAVQHSQVQGIAPRKVEPLRVGPRLQQLHRHLQGQNTQGGRGRVAGDEAPGGFASCRSLG